MLLVWSIVYYLIVYLKTIQFPCFSYLHLL
nr:MAG TPA: hypothetical protein [Bacteriophage sp.]